MQLTWEEYDARIDTLSAHRITIKSKIVDTKRGITLEEYSGWEDDPQYDIYYKDIGCVGYVIPIISHNLLLIDNIFVEERYQGKHIASKVLAILAEAYGVDTIFGQAKGSAIPFWNKFGADIKEDVQGFCDEYLYPFEIKWARQGDD